MHQSHCAFAKSTQLAESLGAQCDRDAEQQGCHQDVFTQRSVVAVTACPDRAREHREGCQRRESEPAHA